MSINEHDHTCPLMLLAEKQLVHSHTGSIFYYLGAVSCCILIDVRCHWLKVKTAYLLGIRCIMCLSCDDFEILFKSLDLFYVSILRK